MTQTSLTKEPTVNLYRLLDPITLQGTPRSKFINWAGTFHCTPKAVFEPTTTEDCQVILELARREGRIVRAVGAGHSPSDLACTNDFMIRTDKLDSVIEINVEKEFVTVGAGTTLYALHRLLANHGLAMRNVGSISDQSLAGIVATATHGSGFRFRVISDDVLGLTVLKACGTVVHCSREKEPDLFLATLCGLGSTGLILSVQLAVEKAFRLRDLQKTITFDEAIHNFDHIVMSSEHVRLWWFPHCDMVRISSANRTYQPADPPPKPFYNELLSHHLVQLMLLIARHLVFLLHYTVCFVVWLENGFSEVVADSHTIFNMDCRFPQHTTEWAVPYDRALSCILSLRAWLLQELGDPKGLRPHFPIEIRFTDQDNIWLSPSNGQKTCWIGIIQYRPYGCAVPYIELFRRFEAILAAHGGRPHWAKAHSLRPTELRRLYPRFDEFVNLVNRVDPQGIFQNEYVRRHLMGESGQTVDASLFQAGPDML